jgi:5-methyltetrahydropteroyltriglutamate--homocysteine methyltransferase
VLQIDAPDAAMGRHMEFRNLDLAGFKRAIGMRVEALNHALAGIPEEQIRYHVCWGNYEGPHTHDVPFEHIQPMLYEANVGALVLSMANARHAHEHQRFERRPLPDDKVLVAGVIDTTNNFVEHPEVVADRLVAIARSVGDPHRIIAGTDCGFDTSAGIGDVAPSVVWEKLRSLRAGADLTSERILT